MTTNYGDNDCSMTLRDYFAAHVIGAIYVEYTKSVRKGECQAEQNWRAGLAYDAYKLADAMLAERTGR